MNRAVFLDRDGVINPLCRRITHSGLVEYTAPWRPDEFKIYPWVGTAFAILKKLNYKLIVVTNQRECGNGILTSETIKQFHDQLFMLGIDAAYFCTDPNSPNYKPGHAAVLRLANDYNIDVFHSYMIGDRWKDIVCGFNSGLKTIRVRSVGTTWDPPEKYQHIQPNFSVDNLLTATQCIQHPDWFSEHHA